MRLINGDCLEEIESIESGSIDMVLTDPPYGMTQCKWDSVIDLDLMWEQLNRVAKPNAAIVMTSAQPFTTKLISSNYEMFKYCWIWQKPRGTGHLNAKKQPLRNAEDVCVFYRTQCSYNPQMRMGHAPYETKNYSQSDNYGKQSLLVSTESSGERYPLTVVEFKSVNGSVHPTQKPVDLMEYLIKTYTDEGETVLDFTMGSGTTGVACVNLNRDFVGIELDKEYFDISRNRIHEAEIDKRNSLF